MEIGTVCIFEDHSAIVAGLHTLMSNEVDAIVHFQTKEDFFGYLTDNHPDVIVADVVVPGVSGLEIFDWIAGNQPALKTVAYTGLESLVLITALLQRGVRGFVNKREPLESLVDAIRTVAKGSVSFPESYHQAISKFFSNEKDELQPSPRELEVLKLVSQGHTSAKIAQMLFISENTVENHRKHLFQKFKVKSNIELVMEAMKQGYFSV